MKPCAFCLLLLLLIPLVTSTEVTTTFDGLIEPVTPVSKYEPSFSENDYLCNKIALESDHQAKVIISSMQTCLLPPSTNDYFDFQSVSNLSMSSIQDSFIIPTRGEEVLDETSYLKILVDVDSKYGAIVLVKDTFKDEIIYSFIHPEAESGNNSLKHYYFMSNTDEIQVVYWVLVIDAQEPTSKTEHMTLKNRKGFRNINIKDISNQLLFDMTVHYEDVPFVYKLVESDDQNGTEFEFPYVPNSVSTFVINKHSLCPTGDDDDCEEIRIGVVIEIDDLDLDFQLNDYLIVGSGAKPVFWANSKAQMITSKSEDKRRKIWVNADSAYLSLVTHNSLKTKGGLRFHWKPANTTIKIDDKNNGPNSRLRLASLQMCFVNMDCMTWENTVQHEFIKEFVHIVNNYLMDNEENVTILINSKSVVIVDQDSSSRIGTLHTEQTCQIGVAVASPYDLEYPLVGNDILNKMFFGNSESRRIFRDKILITNCNDETIGYWKIILPIVFILLISSLIMAFFWRFQEYFSSKEGFKVPSKDTFEQSEIDQDY